MSPELPVHFAPGQQQDAEGQQNQDGDGKADGVPATLGGMGHESLGKKRQKR
ncbi:hypothetical protein D9M70_605220 [compost metagenome]